MREGLTLPAEARRADEAALGSSPVALQSDIGGRLLEVAIHVRPGWLAAPDTRAALEHLVTAFNPSTRLVLLVAVEEATAVSAWLVHLQRLMSSMIIPVPAVTFAEATAWMRDALICAVGGAGEPVFLQPATQKRSGQAGWLANAGPQELRRIGVALDGGDCLVGDGFWIVGANAVTNTASLTGSGCKAEMAVAKLRTLDPRRLVVAGYRIEDLKYRLTWVQQEIAARRHPAAPSEPLWRRPFAGLRRTVQAAGTAVRDAIAPSRLVQDWAHIDLVLALTGTRRNGKPCILVASTTLPECPESMEAWSKGDRLDALALEMTRQGFEVIRTPAPFMRGRILPYCNVILQREPKTVWLPIYDGSGLDAAAADARNIAIWRDLGFTVIPVRGWAAVLNASASIRCATLPLRRAHARA